MSFTYTLIGLALIPLTLFIHFFWSKYRITHHPHVESIHIALPSIADEIQSLAQKIALIAQIETPNIYIFRAQFSNAFIITARRTPYLFLSDELLEECNALGVDAGIGKLEWTICHEIAHIQRHDALPIYIVEIVSSFASLLQFKKLSRFTEQWRFSIEEQADSKADILYKSIRSTTK